MYQGSPPRLSHIIACKVLHAELAGLRPPEMGITEIEAFLHRTPAELSRAIQQAVDGLAKHVETVIIAYGLCSRAVEGLRAAGATLVIPKADDCLALLMGSRKAYTDYLAANPGSYFLSRGWLEAGVNMLEDYAEHERRFGSQKARRIHQQMFANYKRLVFIETGGAQAEHALKARQIANFCRWRFANIKGSDVFLRQLVNGPYDDEHFVVVKPGDMVKAESFFNGD